MGLLTLYRLSHRMKQDAPLELCFLLTAIARRNFMPQKKAKEFFSNFINGTSLIEPSIIYPLVTTSYSPKQIHPIDSLTSQMKCLTLGLSRKFPRAIFARTNVSGWNRHPFYVSKKTQKTD